MGIRWVYLAFDATDREICREIRGSYRAYEASRKAIENLRALRRIRVVLAVTVVKGLNDRDLGNVVDFALENRDVVKRISISAEVYCGRQTTSEDLLRNRVTAEHIEGVLREKLGVRMPTMSLAVVGVLLAPLKAAGIIRSGYWVETMPHPLCGNIGILGKRSDGRFTSLIDRAVRRPTRVYRYAARVERLAERMGRRRDALSRSAAGRGLWKLLAFGGYLPLYFVMLLSFLRPGFAWRALAASLFSFVSRKKARNVLLGRKRVEIHYLIGCDKYNFTWERMPYCATHHYRLDPRSGEILKMCGCYVIPFRPYANACGKIE